MIMKPPERRCVQKQLDQPLTGNEQEPKEVSTQETRSQQESEDDGEREREDTREDEEIKFPGEEEEERMNGRT